MTLEQLKDRKNEFISKMNKFKEISDSLDKYDDYLKDRFKECKPFDDFSWSIFELGLFSWANEFFHDFDIDSEDEISYFVYELKWGELSRIKNDSEYDVMCKGKTFTLDAIESLWEWIIWCIDNKE